MKTLYHKSSVICNMKKFFYEIFSEQTKPTQRHLFDLVMSVFTLNGYESVKFNYEHFICEHSDYKLKSYYYALNESVLDIDDWTEKLIKQALKLLPPDNKQPIVLSIDDTMVEKFGDNFECRSKLFDHANHNGSAYLDGHCFVCLLLSVPIQDGEKSRYLNIPVGYRMWTKEKSKLDIAAELVKTAMSVIGLTYPVCLCCDSWYPKGSVLDLPSLFENLMLICNVRSDTVLYDLPPKRTGKKGRPRIRGDKLSLDDFSLSDVSGTDYLAGSKIVLTNLFGNNEVLAIVTKSTKGESKRLFLCSNPKAWNFSLDFLTDSASAFAKADSGLLALSVYSLRWNIEVSFYEQKTFWSLSKYMLRSQSGIECLINLLSIIYSSTKLLPFFCPDFAALKSCSSQQSRFLIGDFIRKQLFLLAFANDPILLNNNHSLTISLNNLASDLSVGA